MSIDTTLSMSLDTFTDLLQEMWLLTLVTLLDAAINQQIALLFYSRAFYIEHQK